MQELKTAVKAVAATAVGALMLGATLAGAAMAATSLGDFPTPFVKDGAWSGKIVVGTGGTDRSGLAQDLVGALDIAAALGQQTVKLESAAGTGTVDLSISATQGKQFDVPFGIFTNGPAYFGSKLTQTDLPMLFDGKVRATGTGTQFRAHEEVSLDGFGTTQRSRAEIYEDEAKIKLDMQQLSLLYRFIFDDQVSDINSDSNLTCAGDFTASNGLTKLEVPTFLGKKLTFTCIAMNDATSTFGGTPYVTVEQGDYQTLKPGDSYKSGDYTIKVGSVDTSSTTGKVSVTVTGPTGNSESKILTEGTSYQFLSGGIEVKANAVIKDAAELVIGTTVSKTINNHDSEGWYANKDYRVRIGASGSDKRKPVIEIGYKYPYGTTERVDVNAMNPGDKVNFVNDAFQFQYISSKATLASDALKIEKTSDLAFTTNTTQASTSVAVIKVTWPSTMDMYTAPQNSMNDIAADKGSATAERANYMLLYTGADVANNSVIVSYQDTKGTIKMASNYTFGNWSDASASHVQYKRVAQGKYKDSNIDVWLSNRLYGVGAAGPALYVNATTTDTIPLNDIIGVKLVTSSGTFSRVGSSSTPVDADLVYNSTLSSGYDKYMGAKDKNYITLFGMKINAPKTSLGSGDGSVSIYLPDTQDKARILVGKSATTSYKAKKKGETVSGVTVDDVSVTDAKKATVVPISVPVASLDTEITDKTANNMILVGGPSVNSLVKDLAIKKEDFKDTAGNAIGKLILKDGGFAAGKQVLVVAGWDAANTRAAAYVLAHYSSYKDKLAAKTEVMVSGTELATAALTVA